MEENQHSWIHAVFINLTNTGKSAVIYQNYILQESERYFKKDGSQSVWILYKAVSVEAKARRGAWKTIPPNPAARTSGRPVNRQSCTHYVLRLILKLPFYNNYLVSKENCSLGNLSCYTPRLQCWHQLWGPGGSRYFLRATSQLSKAPRKQSGRRVHFSTWLIF